MQADKSDVADDSGGQIPGHYQSFIRFGGSMSDLYQILQKWGTPKRVVFIGNHRNAEIFAFLGSDGLQMRFRWSVEWGHNTFSVSKLV